MTNNPTPADAEKELDDILEAFGYMVVNNPDESRLVLKAEAKRRLQSLIDAAHKESAKQIWEDEQKANKALAKLPVGTADYELMSGRLLGLQRARDIVEAQLSHPAPATKSDKE